MTESDKEANSLSVAARIRMYQTNFNSSETKVCVKKNSNESIHPPAKPKRAISEDGKKDQPKLIKLPDENERAQSVHPRETSLSGTSSNEISSYSPCPSPTAKAQLMKVGSPKVAVKRHSLGEKAIEKDIPGIPADKLHEKLIKPPLPSKPAASQLNAHLSKDLNDNCNVKPEKVASQSNVKPKLKPKVSSERLSESSKQHVLGKVNLKRLSGPPSRPLPPGPKPHSNSLIATDIMSSASELKNISNQVESFCEDDERVYEDPNQFGSNESDLDYEEPEILEGDKKGRNGVVQSTAKRRPPPLPLNNLENTRKSVKPPPLPSRNSVSIAEDQSLYSYASDTTEMFSNRVSQPGLYETPDVSSVRGLMLGIQQKSGTYETPDSSSVMNFLANVNEVDATDDATYETPDKEVVDGFTNALKKNESGGVSDSDSDDYCEPNSVDPSQQRPGTTIIPQAPQKNLPPPPLGEEQPEAESSDDDSGHDYEDPSEEIRPSARLLSLRRGSQPVFNPEAYLALDEMDDMDDSTTYQDPAEAFASMKGPVLLTKPEDKEDEYEDLADEPLYQVYAADVLSEMRRQSKKEYKEDDIFNEYSTGSIEAGQRLLWCQLPSVRDSGVLDELEPRERKRQEAMFEVITSEASYLKSLSILVNHFMNEFLEQLEKPSEERLIDKQQFHFIFGGLAAIRNTSEKFLHSLRGKQQENFIISSISDIVTDYATKHFECYVKYCSNQVYQERTLSALGTENQAFIDILGRLESSSRSQGLSLQSFLVLPMQRITRLPLLMDAICHQCEPGSEEFNNTDKALSAIHKVVKACNEGARKMERIEEMYFVQQMLSFKMKPIPIVSSSRWLLRRGELVCLENEKKARTFKALLRGGKYYRIYLFLFNDLLLVTKMKGEENFKVVDYCSRTLIRIDEEYVPTGDTLKPGTVGIPTNKHMFSLILLENHQRKTATYVCLAETETEKVRWIEAINPKTSGEQDGEKIYEEWDCPQVRTIHDYQAQQPDELNLREGDVIKVLRKLPDGWYEGVHLLEGEQGWFPANFTEEIHSEHTKARNLMQRYRLINTVTLAFDSKSKKISSGSKQ